jgi:hypothetical protein
VWAKKRRGRYRYRPEARWEPDPTGRFSKRWWTGRRWTSNVIDTRHRQRFDEGVDGVAPLIHQPPRVRS